jgi:dimethylargininase
LLDFDKFNKIVVPNEEYPAVNCLNINGTLLIPARYPKTKEII